MPTVTIADMIFDNPTQNDLNPTSLTPTGGRLMSSAPHTDGLILIGAQDLERDTANLVLTRNGKDDWSLNRTATAASETFNISASLDYLLRTGEKYYFDQFGQDNKVSAPAKGMAVIDFFAIYKSSAVALTSATLRLGKLVYSTDTTGATAPTQTDLVAATAISTVNSAQYRYQAVAVPTPAMHVDNLGLVRIELVVTMPINAVLIVAGLGCHCNFNFN